MSVSKIQIFVQIFVHEKFDESKVLDAIVVSGSQRAIDLLHLLLLELVTKDVPPSLGCNRFLCYWR